MSLGQARIQFLEKVMMLEFTQYECRGLPSGSNFLGFAAVLSAVVLQHFAYIRVAAVAVFPANTRLLRGPQRSGHPHLHIYTPELSRNPGLASPRPPLDRWTRMVSPAHFSNDVYSLNERNNPFV